MFRSDVYHTPAEAEMLMDKSSERSVLAEMIIVHSVFLRRAFLTLQGPNATAEHFSISLHIKTTPKEPKTDFYFFL